MVQGCEVTTLQVCIKSSNVGRDAPDSEVVNAGDEYNVCFTHSPNHFSKLQQSNTLGGCTDKVTTQLKSDAIDSLARDVAKFTKDLSKRIRGAMN